jgi:hypothetical protein
LPGESPGPRTFTCPMGTQCDDNGTCVSTAPAPLPVCGSTDPSNGYDAGSGPGPQSGATCAECVGCPRGSECVCGVAGVRCANAGADLACFVTGAIGTCQVFPGDCATNDQCRSTPATPVCSPDGNCVECLRDSDCRQDGGLQGCVQRRCGPCCRMNADCPVGSMCASGFCYACDGDAGCNKGDGGAQLADGGAPPDAGSPTDASDTGSFPDATTDAVDATGG